jgi:hypothetical protein
MAAYKSRNAWDIAFAANVVVMDFPAEKREPAPRRTLQDAVCRMDQQ